MKQIKRLDNLDVLDIDKSQEIYRANAITQGAVAYIKTVNLQIRLEEIKNKKINLDYEK
jgi:hypothetical protein